MSTKQRIADLEAKVEQQRVELEEAQDLAEVHLRNLERLTDKASRTDDAEAALKRIHIDRQRSWSRAAVLESDIADRDLENVKLAKELEAAIAALGSLPADVKALTQVAVDFCVEARTSKTTAGILWARRLESEMGEAGFPVAAEVEIRAQLGGAS